MVYTIGYERRPLEELLGLLLENGVAVLVDVREAAWSRRGSDFRPQGLNSIHMFAL